MLQRTLPAGFIPPCLPTKTDRLPSGGQWLHEIKHDGFRIIARKSDGRVRLYSRPGNDFTRRFPLIVETLARLIGGLDAVLAHQAQHELDPPRHVHVARSHAPCDRVERAVEVVPVHHRDSILCSMAIGKRWDVSYGLPKYQRLPFQIEAFFILSEPHNGCKLASANASRMRAFMV